MKFINSIMNEMYLENTQNNYINIGYFKNQENFIKDSTKYSIKENIILLPSKEESSLVYDNFYIGKNVEIVFKSKKKISEEEPDYFLKLYRRVNQIYSKDSYKDNNGVEIAGEHYIVLDRELIYENTYIFDYINLMPNINMTGEILNDCMNNQISSGYDINSQNIIACERLSMNTDEERSGLLIYDKIEEIITGTFYADSISEISGVGTITLIKGAKNPNVYNELNKNDLVKINNKKYIIYDIINNSSFRVIGNAEGTVDVNIFKLSKEQDDIETIIYGNFDYTNKTGNDKYKSIFSIRPNRKIYYKFGAKEIHGSMNGKYVDLGEEWSANDKIYKLWINGTLVSSENFDIDYKNKRITNIKESRRIIRPTYNYFVYIKYNSIYENGRIGSNGKEGNAILRYYAFDTNFATNEEYLTNLYRFNHYENFTENLNNVYAEIDNKFTDIKDRVLKTRDNKLNFTSMIGVATEEDDLKLILDDISEILVNKNNFRIIRFIKDADKFVIYTNCQLITPPSETSDKVVDKLSYTIDFKNKIVFKGRLFGEGLWGRFNPFGLKQISNTSSYGGKK